MRVRPGSHLLPGLLLVALLGLPSVAIATVHDFTIDGDEAQATTCSVGSTSRIVGTASYDDVTGLFHRERGASVFASSRGYRLPSSVADLEDDPADLLERVEKGELEDAVPLEGFDTYWYNWVIVNPKTELLGR